MPKADRKTPSSRRIRLSTVAEVRAELARTYRHAERGAMSWADATKAAHILSIIARLIEGSTLEQRIACLEQQIGDEPLRASRINGHAHHRHARRSQ